MEQNKTIKIEFTETTKTVNANVKIEVSGDNINNNQILEETKKLFDEAHSYAKNKTMQKAL